MPDSTPEFRKYAKEAFRQMDEVRSGGSEREEEFERFLGDCDDPHFSDPPPFPDEVIEEEYRKLQRRLRPGKLIVMRSRWGALAAGVVLALGLGGVGYRLLNPSTEKLLAQAYGERRNSDFRIAGADFAEIRQQRAGGSALNMPEAFLKAQSRLGGPDRDDAGLLRLRGEAQMIGSETTEAVRTLERARDLDSKDARVLADLGVAYAMRGDAADQFGDYSAALDSLERSLRQRPGDLETMFNRAVVLEKLMLFDQAAIEWKAYLKADGSSGWAKEARRRLTAIEEKMQKREKALGLVRDDPEFFLALAGAGGVDAEAWVTAPIPLRWLERSGADPAARRAVAKLAEILAEKHGDTWLREMMAAPCAGTGSVAAMGELLAADGKATEGDYAASLAGAERAAQDFMQAGCVPGALRARVSKVASLQTSIRTEECSVAGKSLRGDLEQHSYTLLRAIAARRYGVCESQLGHLDESSAVLDQARILSRQAGYAATALDLTNMNLDKTARSGLPSQALAGAQEVMRNFWEGSYRRGLLYPTLFELWQKARDNKHPAAALRFAQSAVWSTSGPDKLPIWNVGAYGNLAASEQELGDWKTARAELEVSNRFADNLPAEYRLAPAIALARLDLAYGDARSALERIRPLGIAAAKIPVPSRGDYYTALGEALTRNGSRDEAIALFRNTIAAGTSYIASVTSEDDRSGLLKRIEITYRDLVATQLAMRGNETLALRTWQAFRNAEAPRDANVPILWFFEGPDGYVSWFARENEVFFHRIEAPKETVHAVAERFLRQCSDPLRPADSLQADARTLYEWMVSPFTARLGNEGHEIAIELDGALSGLPVQALVSSDGHYLVDQFPVSISEGAPRGRRTTGGANARLLVVADPTIAGASVSRFPALPDSRREAEAVRAFFPGSVILQGSAASVESLRREMPNADIVHFAGHGFSNSGFGGLLFAPKDPATADYQLLRAADMRLMDWSRCSLVVLSACATAEGEAHGAHNPESLIRALVKAGAFRVAASLWNVDSTASAELMTKFYSGLSEGREPAAALQMAQRALRRNLKWDHPYYWAGFQLYGSG